MEVRLLILPCIKSTQNSKKRSLGWRETCTREDPPSDVEDITLNPALLKVGVACRMEPIFAIIQVNSIT
jgi:hypothetical protein